LGFPGYSDFLDLAQRAGPPERSELMDRDKIKKLLQEVILNDKAQQQWIDNVDPDFISAMETVIKRYTQDPSKDSAQIFRTGIMLGAVYERWRQAQSAQHSQ
jgi:SPX domain protein involved in polyphosphate accumulation